MRGLPATTLRQLDGLFSAGTMSGLPDGELLGRFACRRDEAAFAALVERHGPMVLGVCRRVLGCRHDAEDAYQSTFLVLARKADMVRVGDTLAPWLYGVASRVASEARRRRARERTSAKGASAMKTAKAEEAGADGDLLDVLDAELGRLPEKYRGAIVLCDLDGMGRCEAADRLGMPEGTLSSRLARGRALLRARLIRRGVVVPATAAAFIRGAKAAVPRRLVDATLLAATRFAAGRSAAGAASASALSLTEGVLKAMLLTKLKVTAVTVAIGLATAAWAAGQAPGTPEGRAYDRGRALVEQPADLADRLREMERKVDLLLGSQGAVFPKTEAPAPKATGPSPSVSSTDAKLSDVEVSEGGPGSAVAKPEPGIGAGGSKGDDLDPRSRRNPYETVGPANKSAPTLDLRKLDGRRLGVEERLVRIETVLDEVLMRLARLEATGNRNPGGGTSKPIQR